MAKVNIMIVEDDAITAMDLENQLKNLGYGVSAKVAYGEDAIQKAKENTPDLVLMDIVLMGEIDGIEAAEEIRAQFGIPVIFLTSFADKERLERAKLTYPFGFIIKPFQPKDLEVTIEMALYTAKVDTERKQAEEALRQAHDELEQRVEERTAELAKANEQLKKEIVGRKRIEKDLRLSEELYRTVVQDQTEVISRFRVDGTFTFVNDVYCRFFGKSSQELLGKKWQPVAVSENVAMIEEKLETLSKDNPTVIIENRVYSGSGEIRLMQFVNRGFFDKEGQLIEIQSVGRDINDRKLAEETLQREKLLNDSIIDNMPAGIAFLDNDFVLRKCNPAYAELIRIYTPYSPEQAIGMSYFDYVPGSRSQVEEWFQKVRDSGQEEIRYGFKLVIERDGQEETTYWDTSIAPVLEPSGKAQGILILTQDVTERRRAEEEVRDSEEKYRTVLETNPDPVVVYDMEGKVIYFNPAFTNVFGWTLDKRLGKKMDVFVPEENWPETNMMIDKVMTGEMFSGIETRRYTKEGKIIPVSISAAFYRDRNGKPMGSVINLRDIREQKQIQEQLARSERLAATGQLAASIAHEINSPLQAVTILVDMMKSKYRKEGRPLEEIELLGEAFVNIRDTVQNLLDLSHPGKEEKQPADVNEIIDKTFKLVRSHLKKNKVKVNLDLTPNVPIITASPQQLSQVFLNLINNSVEAMSGESGIRSNREKRASIGGEIFVKTNLEKGDIVIEVSDTGPGFLEEDLGHIFDHFFTGKKKMGMGVGLSVCHGIIENHNGTITARNSPEGWAVFTITLPVA